jgi:hypothetical protein
LIARRLSGQQFAHEVSGISISDVSLADCEFRGCIARRNSGAPYNTFERIDLERMAQANCSVFEAVFRDVTLTDLKQLDHAPLLLWGCAFERVTLRERICGLQIGESITPRRSESVLERKQREDLHARFIKDFYARSDWAIDISQAEFPASVTFEALPGHKIKRDPSRQVMVSRDALGSPAWRGLDFDGSGLDNALTWFERYSFFDNVVLAARSDRKWSKRDLAVLARLRDTGMAE